MRSDTRRSGNTILETVKLSRVVDGKALVEGITIQVRRGDILAIVGPSGSGKTSFLRLLNRLDEPTGGTVRIDGMDYREMRPSEVRRRLGMVMQTPCLFPGTVSENLQFGPRQRGETLSNERVDQLLERVGLSGYAGRDVNRLSGGEAQRVSLARTLANSPEVLLLDEPTSALDDAIKKEVESLILEILAAEKLTCLIVTHDQAQAARMAHRVMRMERGRLIKMGSVEEVLHAR